MLSAIETDSEPLEAATPEHPLIGKVVEQRYRVLSHIGSGGMADVYEVEHVALGRRLAMKVLRQTRSSNPHLVRRFNREARAASRIDSEHVVGIVDYGMLPEGQPFFVMELLRGQNLRQQLESGAPLTVVRAVNLAIDVCLGLHAAHAAGLVHRDLKPENLWLSRADDGREVCVLLDFGVARFEGAHTTGDGVLVGTARYMSPEQIGSESAPGPASDLFSLAVIVYESLSGKAPFAADSLERTLFRILNESPAPLTELVPEVPLELSDVLARAMSKKAEMRFASALELAAALRPFAGAARPLPALSLAARSILTDQTLAEGSESDDVRGGTGERGVTRSFAPPRRFPAWLVGFAAGLVVAAVLFAWLRPSPPESFARAGAAALKIAPESSSAGALLSAPAVTSVSPPAIMTAAEPPATIAQAASTSSVPAPPPAAASRAISSARPRALLPPPATAAPRSPARPEPPRPNFDGRNPYFQ